MPMKKQSDRTWIINLKQGFVVFLLFAVLPASVQAAECRRGELMLEYVPVNTIVAEPFYTARISGEIEMPHPGYWYELAIDHDEPETMGALSFMSDHDLATIQVISPIIIDDTIKIPHGATSLLIDVVKDFNWGAEYFKAEFYNGLFNAKPICMKGEMYK